MKQLFEYLISKENKKKISFGIKTKFDIKRGDIIETDDGDYFIALNRDDVYSCIGKNYLYNEKAKQIEKYGIIFVQYYFDTPSHYVWCDLDEYSDDFKPIDCDYKIVAIYLAPHNWEFEDSEKYTPEFLKDLSKKMTKIEIKS